MFAGDFAAVAAKRELKTPATDGLQFKIPVTPSAGSGELQTPTSTETVQTPLSAIFVTPTSKRKGKPQPGSDSKATGPVPVKIEKSDSARVRGARIVKEIFEEAYPRWQALVKVKIEGSCAEKARGYGLERFESGAHHPSTRYTQFLTYLYRVCPNSPYL